MDARNDNPGLPRDPEARLGLFESLLRQDLEAPLDFAKMEKALLERIQKADALGPLAALKADAIPPAGFFDKVEADLFARIHDTMPPDNPGSLSAATAADIEAYILSQNQIPAGSTELAGDQQVQQQIRISSFKP